MSEEFKKAKTLVDQLKEYVNTRVSQAKLSVAEKTSKVVSLLVALLVIALVFFLFLVLASVAAAIAIGQWLNSMWLGFLIVAGLCLLLCLVIWLAKDRLLRIPVMNMIIEALFGKEEENEKD
jgi:membrane protein implicated in regulation of membrane protease activity